MAEETSSRTGPAFVRNALLPLDKIRIDQEVSGWREISPERVQELFAVLLRGKFGMTVTCDVQVLESESTDNKKLIDDGMSTVCALVQAKATRDQNPDVMPCGDPWPQNLIDIFTIGLPVKVVKYTEDGDKDARFRWKVAEHENDTVRRLTAYQQISAVAGLYKTYGDWDKVRVECRKICGIGKKHSINRWVRAASGMSAEVLKELKDHPPIPSAFIFDNAYMVTSATANRNKLGVSAAKKALQLYSENEDKFMTRDTFINVVCKGLRILEIWRSLMSKRYGSVAQNSPAVERVCEQLPTFAGLQSIMVCAAAGLNLHGRNEAQQGIPE